MSEDLVYNVYEEATGSVSSRAPVDKPIWHEQTDDLEAN